jgi:hypothetical protein
MHLHPQMAILGGSRGRTPRPWRVAVDTMWTPLIQNESAALWRRFSDLLYLFLDLGAGEGIRTPDPNVGKVELRCRRAALRQIAAKNTLLCDFAW